MRPIWSKCRSKCRCNCNSGACPRGSFQRPQIHQSINPSIHQSTVSLSLTLSSPSGPNRTKSNQIEPNRAIKNPVRDEVTESNLVWSTAAQHRQNKVNEAKQSQTKPNQGIKPPSNHVTRSHQISPDLTNYHQLSLQRRARAHRY